MTDTAPVRLLLVDDEAALREPLAEYLSRQGFAVTQAASAADARSQLRDETPDCGCSRSGGATCAARAGRVTSGCRLASCWRARRPHAAG